jgi:hypothetical protein
MQKDDLLTNAGAKCGATIACLVAGVTLKEVETWLSFAATLCSALLGVWYVAQLFYSCYKRYRATGTVFKKE